MAKFYGEVGYAEITETSPGVYKEVIVKRMHYGDVTKLASRLKNSGGLNDDVAIDNEISILADPYAMANFVNIRYVKWLGANWKTSNITVNFPRLILRLGGVYNGETGPTT